MMWRTIREPMAVAMMAVVVMMAVLYAAAQDVATWQDITYNEYGQAYPVYYEENENVISARYLIPEASTATFYTVPINVQACDRLVFQLLPDSPVTGGTAQETGGCTIQLLGSAYIDAATPNMLQGVTSSYNITGGTAAIQTSSYYNMREVDLGGLPYVAFKVSAVNATAELVLTAKKR